MGEQSTSMSWLKVPWVFCIFLIFSARAISLSFFLLFSSICVSLELWARNEEKRERERGKTVPIWVIFQIPSFSIPFVISFLPRLFLLPFSKSTNFETVSLHIYKNLEEGTKENVSLNSWTKSFTKESFQFPFFPSPSNSSSSHTKGE